MPGPLNRREQFSLVSFVRGLGQSACVHDQLVPWSHPVTASADPRRDFAPARRGGLYREACEPDALGILGM